MYTHTQTHTYTHTKSLKDNANELNGDNATLPKTILLFYLIRDQYIDSR